MAEPDTKELDALLAALNGSAERFETQVAAPRRPNDSSGPGSEQASIPVNRLMQTRLDEPELGMRGLITMLLSGLATTLGALRMRLRSSPRHRSPNVWLTAGGMLSQPGRLGGEKTS